MKLIMLMRTAFFGVLVVVGCREMKNAKRIIVPPELFRGGSVYVGESLDALKKVRAVTEDPSGGYFEELPAGNIFRQISYSVNDGEVDGVMFGGIDEGFVNMQSIDYLSQMCDAAYKVKRIDRSLIQSDGQHVNVRQWCLHDSSCACIMYLVDDDGRLAKHAVITFEVGCSSLEWEEWRR